MESLSKKRKVAGTSASNSNPKRPKIPTPNAKPSSERPSKSKPKKRINSQRPNTSIVAKGAADKKTHDGKMIDASALAWETLDQEVFGGLQVVRGVDVLKNAGQVQFKTYGKVEDKKEANAKSKSKVSPDGEENKAEIDNATMKSDEEEEGHDEFDSNIAGDDEDNLTPDEDEILSGDDQDFTDSAEILSEETLSKKDKQDHQLHKREQPRKSSETHKDELKTLLSAGNINSFALLTEDMDMDHVEPTIDVSAWKPLGLSGPLLGAISQLKFGSPTKIQQMAIPEIMKGKDVIGKAQTGSGKTLAFGIPIVETWLSSHQLKDSSPETSGKKSPVALILAPTRELAKQIGEHITRLTQGLESAKPYVAVVTGGLSIQKQQRQMAIADIIIGTPGRLWEVIEGDIAFQSSLTKVKFLVVDEADRLFKVGQFKEAEDIIGAVYRRNPEAEDEEEEDDDEDSMGEENTRQTLVFSATFDKGLQHKLARRKNSSKARPDGGEGEMEYLMKCLKFKTEPDFLDANPAKKMAEGLKEGLIECGAMEKDLYLYTLLVLNPNRRTLVFTNSISAVRRLTPLLQNLNLNVQPLHSQMIQKARLRSLERFSAPSRTLQPGQPAANNNSILVATDVAARGLDINDIDQVIHYHVPRTADTYIHRSGRTARGDNKQGISVLLCAPDEVLPTRRLAAKVHSKNNSSTERLGNSLHMIQSLPLDRKLPSRLKPRLELSKRITDAALAKEKANSSQQWLRSAAEDLGVDYTSDLSDNAPMGGSGRGGGRKRKEKQATEITKAEMRVLRGKLRDELSRRVNLGVSEKYVTGGRVDVGKLLREREEGTVMGLFLGGEGLGLEF